MAACVRFDTCTLRSSPLTWTFTVASAIDQALQNLVFAFGEREGSFAHRNRHPWDGGPGLRRGFRGRILCRQQMLCQPRRKQMLAEQHEPNGTLQHVAGDILQHQPLDARGNRLQKGRGVDRRG